MIKFKDGFIIFTCRFETNTFKMSFQIQLQVFLLEIISKLSSSFIVNFMSNNFILKVVSPFFRQFPDPMLMWDLGSLKKGLDRCWVNWAWLTMAYLDHYMNQFVHKTNELYNTHTHIYIYIYIYWLSKRKDQQVHSTKISNDNCERFKKFIFD